MSSFITRSSFLVFFVWIAIIIAFCIALYQKQWDVAMLTFVAFCLTLLPYIIQEQFDVHIPEGFLAAIVVFIYATLVLGEVSDFYEKFWWWDILLHIGSSIGFGLVGFVILLLMHQGNRFRIPIGLLCFFAFTFALAWGALWEIWEFTLDQVFGLNTQKSGLPDTMTDLIIDGVSGALAAFAGYLYLKRGKKSPLDGVIREAFRENASAFRKKFFRRKK